jgi:Domain of unknown function (DUF6532)
MSSSAQEVKARVDLKRGISRFLPAREYFRAARSACQYAKVSFTYNLVYRSSYLSDHSMHHQETWTMPTILIYRVHSQHPPAVGFTSPFLMLQPDSVIEPEFIFNRVMSVARPLYRCYLGCQDAFPSHDMMDDWLAYVWFEACARTEIDPCSLTFPHPNEASPIFLWNVALLHFHSQLVISTITLLTDMKAKITHLVESLYGFDTSRAPNSISHNARRAQALLANMAFVSRVRSIVS